jgi:mRNA interferase RelE/StbE
MASFEIRWKKSARKELKKLPKEAISRILSAVEDLSGNPLPTGCRKIVGSGHTYRIRSGVYRVIYSVKSEILCIEVIKVGHRKEIYKKL